MAHIFRFLKTSISVIKYDDSDVVSVKYFKYNIFLIKFFSKIITKMKKIICIDFKINLFCYKHCFIL